MPGVRWVPGDLHDASILAELGAGAAAVVHCAGAVRGAARADFDRINADATRRLAEASAQLSPAPRLLLISSLAAREPDLSDYAASKRAGEIAVERASDSLRWTILRPPAVYGPGDRELVPLFRAMASGFAPLPAAGGGRFSLLHVEDLARAVVCWLQADTADRMTFEVDDGRPGGYDWPTVIEIAGRVLLPEGRSVRPLPIPSSLLNLAARVNLIGATVFGYSPMLTPGKVRELRHPDWVCRQSGFAAMTGWQPQYGFERGLAGLRLGAP